MECEHKDGGFSLGSVKKSEAMLHAFMSDAEEVKNADVA